MSSTMAYDAPTYLKAFFPKALVPLNFQLGEHAHELRFTVTIDPLTPKTPLLLLHDGTKPGQILAMISKPELRRGIYESVIQINAATLHPTHGGLNPTTFVMACQRQVTHNLYQFSVQLGSGPEPHKEKFEWRSTRGTEINAMFKHAKGYKLVRMGTEGPGGKRGSRQDGQSSDGKEIVAVWATQSLIPGNLIPGGKPFKFELCGSGKDGSLGERFIIIALVTALKIWSAEIQCLTGVNPMDSMTKR
ncbi:hypothetical protein GGR54DRAFT_592732 [Hypoxylon sp. NC1633]|nr:hypothetical protein GGR54DRAFT_592732 [Hypoxylon sp. NC1633]